MTDQTQAFDIVILGAGLAGCAQALSILAQPELAHLSVALIENSDAANQVHPSFDGRALALAQNTVDKLADWQVWPLCQDNANPIEQIQVTEQNQFGYSHLGAAELGFKQFGYVMEAQMLGAALLQKLQQYQQRVSWLRPDSVVELVQNRDQVSLTLQSGKLISSRLVIGADGANSQLRQLLGFEQQVLPYEQKAIIANVEVAQMHRHIAYERFTECGPLAMLPMTATKQNRFGLVWCHPPERAEQLVDANEDEFIDALQQAFGFRSGKINSVGQRDCYHLSRLYSPKVMQHRCLIIGNAAHTVHPIAGQGFNLGLRDIAQVTQTLVNQAQGDLASFQAWCHYRQQRTADVESILSVTDGLVRCFSNQYQPLRAIRNASLLALQRIPPLKRSLAYTAMGYKK